MTPAGTPERRSTEIICRMDAFKGLPALSFVGRYRNWGAKQSDAMDMKVQTAFCFIVLHVSLSLSFLPSFFDKRVNFKRTWEVHLMSVGTEGAAIVSQLGPTPGLIERKQFSKWKKNLKIVILFIFIFVRKCI